MNPSATSLASPLTLAALAAPTASASVASALPLPAAELPSPRPARHGTEDTGIPRHVAMVGGSVEGSAARECIAAALEHGVGCLSLPAGSEAAAAAFIESLRPRCSAGQSFFGSLHITFDPNLAPARTSGDAAPWPADHRNMADARLRLHLFSENESSGLPAAIQRLAQRVQRGELQPGQLAAADLDHECGGDGLPAVDLLLHTADAPRLSRTLLWKAAYAELYFSAARWEQFGRGHFAAALADYARRRRTFGGLK